MVVSSQYNIHNTKQFHKLVIWSSPITPADTEQVKQPIKLHIYIALLILHTYHLIALKYIALAIMISSNICLNLSIGLSHWVASSARHEFTSNVWLKYIKQIVTTAFINCAKYHCANYAMKCKDPVQIGLFPQRGPAHGFVVPPLLPGHVHYVRS